MCSGSGAAAGCTRKAREQRRQAQSSSRAEAGAAAAGQGGDPGSGAHAHAKKAGNEAHKGQERQRGSGRQAGCGRGSAANAVQQTGRQGMRAVAAQDSKQKERQAGAVRQHVTTKPWELKNSIPFQPIVDMLLLAAAAAAASNNACALDMCSCNSQMPACTAECAPERAESCTLR